VSCASSGLPTTFRPCIGVSLGRRARATDSAAAKTVRNIHGELHAALKDAVRWGHVARNVAASADLPKGMAPKMRVWSPAQLRAFLDHAREDRLCAAWLLFATTGMRRGEVAGLRWPSTRPRWRPYVSTAPARPRSAWPWGRGGRTRAWCSPGRTAARPPAAVLDMVGAARPGGRPPEDQTARRSSQLRLGRPRRRHPGQGRLRAARAHQHRHHHGHLQPRAPRPGRRGRRHGGEADPGRRRPRTGASR
jgi:integrase